MLGRKHSDETKAKMSAVRKVQGNGLLGKKASEDARANMRAAQQAVKEKAGYQEMVLKRAESKRIPVSIDGVVYGSTRLAAEALGLDPSCVDYRLRSSSKKFKDWFIVRNT